MLFDTHAHLNDPAFDPDRAELMDGLAQKGIGLVMTGGTPEFPIFSKREA